MELQLVNFEQAKALKELGFPQDLSFRECDYWYNKHGHDNHHAELIGDDFSFSDIVCLAPTLELVAKWLREEKSLFTEITLDLGGGYNVQYCQLPWTNTLFDNSLGTFDSYEEALSAGIDKAIKILKENETNNNN